MEAWVFDLVSGQIKHSKICIPRFKRKRATVEITANLLVMSFGEVLNWISSS